MSIIDALPNHDASTGVIRIVSFGFSVLLMPSNAAIINGTDTLNKLLLNVVQFDINETNA